MRCVDHAVEAICPLDDDACLHPTFLSRASRALREAGPKTVIAGPCLEYDTIVYPKRPTFWGHLEIVPSNFDDFGAIAASAMLAPREFFAEIQVDETFSHGYEDADICAQAKLLGWRIKFVPDLMNEHLPP
jgi:GT2 family glycosyltransferase